MFRDDHIQSSVSHSLEVITIVDAIFTLCCSTYTVKNAKTEIIGHLPLIMMKYTVGVKKTAPFPFRFIGNERAEKMACRSARFVPSVPPVLPSNPSACARSNESCLSGDPAHRRVCTRGRQ